MKTLRDSLVDYDLILLRALADQRGVDLSASQRFEAVEQLAVALASPASVAIAVDDLSDEAREALQTLRRNDGLLETPRFSRQFGTIRAIGAGRLEREKPWQAPLNPAEELWYRGLIFRGFRHTSHGAVEVVYIPTDIYRQLVERLPPLPAAEPAFQVAPVSTPAIIRPPDFRLREDFFSLLVYLQTNEVRLRRRGELSTQDLQAINARFSHPVAPAAAANDPWLAFVLHLARRMEIAVPHKRRLLLNASKARAWLQAGQQAQMRQLRDTWRADPTWNDLWRVPGLVPQPTGWDNSPMLGRAKILGFLSRTPPGEWFSLASFIQAVKRFEPDFQRPTGDYQSWYITDEHGNSLQGFENWDRVEGAFIRHLIDNVLYSLGAVELGLPRADGPPYAFRLTEDGRAWLEVAPAAASETKETFAPLQVREDFTVLVPGRASLYDRFQLARLADLKRREPGRVWYEITQQSVGRALRNGITADQMTAFLARATNGRSPLKVVETLRDWGRRPGAARLQRLTLLRLRDDSFLAELRRHPDVGPLLGETVGPGAILVPEENVKQLRQLLQALGYLDAER
ncbi:MAG: helicase-associated domain-containing protein [Anaerolineae bacterium]